MCRIIFTTFYFCTREKGNFEFTMLQLLTLRLLSVEMEDFGTSQSLRNYDWATVRSIGTVQQNVFSWVEPFFHRGAPLVFQTSWIPRVLPYQLGSNVLNYSFLRLLLFPNVFISTQRKCPNHEIKPSARFRLKLKINLLYYLHLKIPICDL